MVIINICKLCKQATEIFSCSQPGFSSLSRELLMMYFKKRAMTMALMLVVPSWGLAEEAVEPQVLPDVNVVGSKEVADRGYASRRSTGATKTDTPLVETAQSVSVVNRQEMDDRNVQDLNEAMAYTAGVRVNVNGNDSRSETYNIRGFTMGLNADDGSSNLFMDGLRVPAGGGWNRASFDTYGLESVEVIKGPSAAVYGQVLPGGMVNLVTKKPTADQINQLRLQYGSFDQKKASFDIGGGMDDQTVLYRLVGSFSDGGTVVDHTDLHRSYLAPSVLFNFTDKTSLTLLAQYQNDTGGSTFQYVPYYGSYEAGPNGSRMKRSTFLGEPDWNRYSREQVAVGWILDHQFNEVWSFKQNLRFTSVDTDYRGVVNRSNGLSGTTGNRTLVNGIGSTDGLTVDNQLKASFEQGAFKHNVLVGLDAQNTHWTYDNLRVNIGAVSIYNPVYTGVTVATDTVPTYDADQKQVGAYLQEQVAWNQWRLSVGGRFDRFDNSFKNVASQRFNDYEDHAFTWRSGLSYVFDNGVSPYVSYSTSFNPGPLSLVTWNNTAIKPVEAEQYEAGIKYQPPGSDSLITAAVYELTQQNRVVTDGDATHTCVNPTGGTTCYAQIGEARIRGLELEAKTALTEQLNMVASYTYSESEVTKSNNAAEVGAQLPYLPKHMAALWGNYVFAGGELDGLTMSLGARYTGSTYNLTTPTSGVADNLKLKLDGYTIFDAAIRYNLKRFGYAGANFALNANNLTDREYVSSCFATTACMWGTARNITATLSYKW
jgi:iron complex outermembrane recepter protein